MNYWAILSAAGLGLRMGAKVPKQYLTIAGKTILEHSLDTLLSHPKITQVVITLHPEDQYWSQLNIDRPYRIKTTMGRDIRSHSVLEGLKVIAEFADADDWVLVHDAVRPCFRVGDLDRLIQQCADHPIGGIVGVPVRDTLKLTDHEGQICQTLPRDNTWQAQTPQMFRFGILYHAMTKAISENWHITDEAGAIELLGMKPLMLPGNPSNIKITYPADLAIAEHFLLLEETEEVLS